jgi:hypothetical protein
MDSHGRDVDTAMSPTHIKDEVTIEDPKMLATGIAIALVRNASIQHELAEGTLFLHDGKFRAVSRRCDGSQAECAG